MAKDKQREGGLDAPTRHALDWQNPEFYAEENFFAEAERIFDICHGCRRCVSLCEAFPTLFDLIDESENFEVADVDKSDYQKVVDQCYLCDLCYQTKCPYVPPHEWNVDFPHLMLRGKAIHYRNHGANLRDRVLTSTTTVGKLATIPLVDVTVNAVNRSPAGRKLLSQVAGIHPEARLPKFDHRTLKRRLNGRQPDPSMARPAGRTQGKVVIFGTCFGSHNRPQIGEDLARVLAHNEIPWDLLAGEHCCGMPKMEIGDLESVAAMKDHNIPLMADRIRSGWDIIAPVPSCVLMFKQELPLMFPEDEDVALVKSRIFDPFEYLAIRHKHGLLKTDFRQRGGRIAYQAACHQRVQNIGPRTRDILSLIPEVEVKAIERCSGHDGTYAVRQETYENSMKIGRPLVRQVKQFEGDVYTSDCVMAADHIAHGMGDEADPPHPITILSHAYGLNEGDHQP